MTFDPSARLPKPNTQHLSWFYGEDEKRTLILTPKYQRNPIWSLGQKCFLIDSLIAGYPIPQVYLNIVTQGSGKSRKTEYEVVDGQQRLRTILEFMSDEWSLTRLTANHYPVSSSYRSFIGKRYSELPTGVQDTIWNYPLAVQELRSWDPEEIKALFRRLNYVVEKLNPQELRHSQYFGPFVRTVEDLAAEDFWKSTDLFTRKHYQRMRDIEFISELFVMAIDGIQDQKKSLNEFYAKYDVEFPNQKRHVAKFKRVTRSLSTISKQISETRFSNMTDFYSLFAAVAEICDENGTRINLSPVGPRLRRLHNDFKKDPSKDSRATAKYRQTVVEGPNKLSKRRARTDYIRALIDRALA